MQATSVLLITTALFGYGIPVVHGFSFLRQSKLSLSQSEGFISRKQADATPTLKYRSDPDENIESTKYYKVETKHMLQKPQRQQQPPKHQISNIFHTWWTASKTKRAFEEAEKQKDEQLILDQYLESIDKRYKRLHSRKRDRGSIQNVALEFLTEGALIPSFDEQRKQEDALHVLGLAELASARLLQKHHLPVPESKHGFKNFIDTPREEKKPLAPSHPFTVVHMPKEMPIEESKQSVVSSAVFCVQVLRDMRAAYANRLAALSESVKFTILASFMMLGRTLKNSAALTLSVISANGGGASKYTMQCLSVFAAATVSVLRPLLKA